MDNNTTQAENVVYVFADRAATEHAFAQLSTEATRKCVGTYFAKGLGKKGLKIRSVNTGALSIAPIGDQRSASRFTVPVSSDGQDLTLYVDLVIVRVDRGIGFTLLFSTFGSFDQSLEAKLVRRSTGRLRAGLAAASR